jgi:hypothetical protein
VIRQLAAEADRQPLLAISADIPDDLIVHEFTLWDLPGTWRKIPAPAELQELGRSWLVEGKAAKLSVPSRGPDGTQLPAQSGTPGLQADPHR